MRQEPVLAPLFVIGFCLTLAATSCHGQESQPPRTATPDEFQRDFPVLEKTLDDLSTLTVEQFEIVSVSDVPPSQQDGVVANPGQTLRAFTVCDEQCSIFVEELGADQSYELRGPFLSWRSFSDVTWLNNDILAFDQWSNPHYGIHYEINFRERKLVSATAVTDVIEP